MKGLMIMPKIDKTSMNGGDIINKRNFNIFNACLDILDILELEKMPRKWRTIYQILFFGNFYGFTNRKKKILFSMLMNGKYDVLILSSSLCGIILNDIKKLFPELKVIVFFHNVEYKFYYQLAERTGKYKKILAFNAKKNEKIAVKYADLIISLNKRDAREINDLYNRKVDFILPTTFEDKYNKDKVINMQYNEKTMLFVGSNFYANLQGIDWFIKNVLPYLKGIKLNVVGKGTEEWKDKFSHVKNLNIVGSVKCLDKYYYESDIVILPIFLGSGMKTKTAEALMYGKYIYGTSESFEGYELDYDKVGGLCNTKDEFILKINNHFIIHHNKYNEYSRHVFNEGYNTQKYIEKTKMFLNNLLN